MDSSLRGAIRVCHAGLDSLALRREVSARVAPVLGVDAHAFSLCDPDTGLPTHTVADGVPPRLGAEFVCRLYPTEVAPLASEMRARGRLVFSVPDHSPAARDALAAHGLRDQLYVSLMAHGCLWATWCVMRADASPRARARASAFLRRLAPHLGRALAVAAQVDAAQVDAAQADAARAAPDAPSDSASCDAAPGVVAVDDRGRIALQTPAAAAMLADLADVGFPTGETLPTAVRTAIAAGAAEVRSRGRSGRRYLISTARAEPAVDGRSATVVVVRAAVGRGLAPRLTSLYGLSPREREVVAAVVRGEPTKGIAAQLGISPHTVDEHLDRACRKVGVRGRKALVARLFTDQARGAAHFS